MKKILDTTGVTRGMRSKLAKYLNCQTGYISQVLTGNTNFSLEHAIQVNRFLSHSEEEADFFMLLVEYERAGSDELRDFYQLKIKKILKSRNEIKNRIKVNSNITVSDFVEYYSHWYYSAVHVLVSIPEFQTKTAISSKLNLNSYQLNKALEFLCAKELINQDGDQFTIGKARIHLDNKSPMIFKHHTNWRMEAIKTLESNDPTDLHYSSVITLSVKDVQKIKKTLLKMLEDIEPILLPSPEEEIYSLCLDFFAVGR